MKLYRSSIVISVLSAAVMLSGCGKGLTDRYNIDDRLPAFYQEQASGKAPVFAADLCVAAGVNGADEAYTPEAGGLFCLSDHQTVFEKNVFEQMYPASITKVMTAIIAIEEGNLDDMVTVTDASVITERGASLCGIKPGDVITLNDLLYGLMIPSGNDAANAIAVHMSGSVEAFAERMNAKARELGATGTHFMNPSGLTDPEHYTTAYDLYLMFNEALKHEKFRDIISTPSYTSDYMDASGAPVQKTWEVGNWYQKGDKETPAGVSVIGGKTGTTSAAGYCLIMASEKDSKEYVSVVLKAENRPDLYNNMSVLLDKEY